MNNWIPPRESWTPYPVWPEIDDETGEPIQPQDEKQSLYNLLSWN